MSEPRVVIQRTDGLFFKVTRSSFEWVVSIDAATVFANFAATATALRDRGRLSRTDPRTLFIVGLKATEG